LKKAQASSEFARHLDSVLEIRGVSVLAAILPGADADSLREMTDRFKRRYPSGIAVLAAPGDGRPVVVAAITDDLVKRGLHAGELVKFVAGPLGGGGGGKPGLAQAGGKDASRLEEALGSVPGWVEGKLS
jgi:alanyl-tRNA synthetase